MDFWQLYGMVVLFVFAFMTALWLASLALGNSSIVDPMWGTGLVLANWFTFLLTPD
jgi:steroid 5-alpha reductase family enzyme